MARRLGKRDALWLSLIGGALVLLAVQVAYAGRGFDRPLPGLLGRLAGSPGHALGWGGVVLCAIALPYAFLAWTQGKSPGRALTAFGALVLSVGVGGLAGVISSPVRGGGRLAGALARMLEDSLGGAMAAVVFAGIALPGLMLSLAPLLLELPSGDPK